MGTKLCSCAIIPPCAFWTVRRRRAGRSSPLAGAAWPTPDTRALAPFVSVKTTKGKGKKFIIVTVCLIIAGLLDTEEATIVSTYVSVACTRAVLICVTGADGVPAISALRLLAVYSRFKRAVASLFVLRADGSPPVQLSPSTARLDRRSGRPRGCFSRAAGRRIGGTSAEWLTMTAAALRGASGVLAGGCLRLPRRPFSLDSNEPRRWCNRLGCAGE